MFTVCISVVALVSILSPGLDDAFPGYDMISPLKSCTNLQLLNVLLLGLQRLQNDVGLLLVLIHFKQRNLCFKFLALSKVASQSTVTIDGLMLVHSRNEVFNSTLSLYLSAALMAYSLFSLHTADRVRYIVQSGRLFGSDDRSLDIKLRQLFFLTHA